MPAKKKPTPSFSHSPEVAEIEIEVDSDKERSFESVANFILNSHKTFTIRSFFAVTRGIDISPGAIKGLFNRWVEVQIANKKVRQIPGIEDDVLYESNVL